MPLNKAKKQIQLYEGISDNVDNFLLPSPAVEYAENCHWRGKEGKLVKRLGSTSETRSPSILHGIGEKLYTFTDTDSYAYDVTADSWDNTTQLPFLTDTSSVTKSERAAGMVSHAYRYITESNASLANGYSIFAYSKQSDSGTTIKVYDPSGDLVLSGTATGGSVCA